MTLILGLETSCDETAAAVVDEALRVRSNVVATQHELHERYAGVVPEIASRAHLERLMPVVEAALEQAGVTLDDLAAVAVGHRPGLVGSLIVGVAAAKALSWSRGVPLVGVDHVEAHLTAAALRDDDACTHRALTYPALGLVVSGGHTTMYALAGPRDLTPLGRTIDDAIGEAFDKAAVMLGLPYPGGPAIDQLAVSGDARAVAFPVSSLAPDSLDFSFSGLKTALLYEVRGRPVGRGRDAVFTRDHTALPAQRIADLAASFQHAAVQAVVRKLRRGLDQLEEAGTPARSLVLGGGVSANRALRAAVTALGEKRGVPVALPATAYCVDNAAMIAGHAHAALAAGQTDDLSLPVVATTRW